MADTSIDVTRRRLAWGCRRGMLELDLLLAPLAERIAELPATELPVVAELLDSDDTELWDLLVARSRPLAPHMAGVLDGILADTPACKRAAA